VTITYRLEFQSYNPKDKASTTAKAKTPQSKSAAPWNKSNDKKQTVNSVTIM
jgi:hypothetical protein